jgi:hypothetical protein
MSKYKIPLKNNQVMKRKLLLILSLGVCLSSCKSTNDGKYKELAADPILLHQSAEQLTNVIVHDIFKPPVASRIYAYTFLAAYETLRNQNPENQSLAGKITGFTAPPAPEKDKEYCYPLASLKAFCIVGKTLTFTAEKWDTYEKGLWTKFEKMNIPDDVYERSVAYGEAVAKHVLDYSGKDNYKQTRGIRFTIDINKPGAWVPTPPTYADACEPKWNSIRSFTLDSSSQFRAKPPVVYSESKNSDFFKLTKEVYDLSKNLTEEQKEIAYFWDDNAFVTNISGHVMFADKKMTPPGHWIAIINTLSKQNKKSMMESLKMYSFSSIALFDAFIASWDEKYRTVRIRPVTVINKFIDSQWLPFLETPGFPEYVSGHSAISASAGKIIIHLIGDNVTFTDSTEHRYGHGVRKFTSISQCYNETSISRVYGGIHYRDGVVEGTAQGEEVGEWVWKKLN